MDNNFIEVWREAYKKMVADTIKAIALAEEQYVKPYIIKKMENPCLLVRFGTFLDKHVSRVSDEQMKEWENLLETDFQYWLDTLVNLKYQLEKNQKIIDFMVKHHINPYRCKDPDIETMTKYFVYIPEKHKK